MLLRELLTLIGFTKLQQISLIKILFLTGCFSFVEPSGLNDLKETIEINSGFLNSEIKEILLFHQTDSTLSNEIAEKILQKAEFKSKTQAYEWLDSIMQRNLFRGTKERFEVKDKFQNNIELKQLIQNFNLNKKLTVTGNFDSILVLGCNENCIKGRIDFLLKELDHKKISSPQIYIIGSERPGFPYLESCIEIILAEKFSLQNKKSVQENLKKVREIFLEVANNHLHANNYAIQYDLESIRKLFKDSPELFQLEKLTSILQNHQALSQVSWPNETEIIEKISDNKLQKHSHKIINTPNYFINGKVIRADTKGNAKIWLEKNGQNVKNKPYKVLLVSNQPYAQYQLNIFKSVLGNNFDIKVIGSESNINNSSLMLSELSALVHTAKDLVFQNEQ